jgi:ketosteroid isomerase-like protein
MRESYDPLNLALARGEDVRPLMDVLDPEFVLEMGVLEGTFTGRDGFTRFIRGQVELFEDLRCDPEEFIDAGDQIVVPMCLRGRARSTGLPLEYHAIHVWTLRDGRAARLRLYESDEVRDLGDRVLGIGRFRIRARGSGVETDFPVAGIATYREGKLVRWEDFRERQLALEAAGLRE